MLYKAYQGSPCEVHRNSGNCGAGRAGKHEAEALGLAVCGLHSAEQQHPPEFVPC